MLHMFQIIVDDYLILVCLKFLLIHLQMTYFFSKFSKNAFIFRSESFNQKLVIIYLFQLFKPLNLILTIQHSFKRNK